MDDDVKDEDSNGESPTIKEIRSDKRAINRATKAGGEEEEQ